MGNTQSSSPLNPTQKSRIISRQRSAVFSHISLGCASADSSIHSSDLDPSHGEKRSLVNEKSIAYRDRDRDDPIPIVFPMAYAPTIVSPIQDEATTAYNAFLRSFPEYQLTWILDTLRRSDYGRLERTGETYVDYMGGALYPESLIRVHTAFLSRSVLGNTHSISNSSKLSAYHVQEARETILSFFDASPEEYAVVFTANATSALKLVGESYQFTGGSSFVLGADSHNSVHGIREYAAYRGARVCYIPSTESGGFDVSTAKNILLRNRPRAPQLAPSLFALTAQSNISNTKNPLSIVSYASSLGYHIILDAAALAPTSRFSLTENPNVDAMAISFYKMFGFPTGVGALVVKKAFLQSLKRPWFSGGNVDVVQVPGKIVTRSHELHEQFEDGTINYLTLPAITDGLRFLSAYLPFLPLRLSSLLHYLTSSLIKLRHDTTGTPVVRILSRLPGKRVKSVGEQADTGSIISMIFLSPTGDMLPNSFIAHASSTLQISLRTGCMCNPGGAAALLSLQPSMQRLYPGVTLKDYENAVGHELGVVRVSLGLASTWADAWKVLRFATMIGRERERAVLWDRWVEKEGEGVGQAI